MTLLHRETGPLLKNPLDYRRDKDSFNYAQEIAKPYGMIEHVLDWCKEELVGEWRWQLIDVSNNHKPGRYCFFFDSERDCLAFTLKWL
jgi:hypothetical protein